MKKYFILFAALIIIFNVNAQNKKNKLLNWYNKDFKSSYFGISRDKAFDNLLKDKKPDTIVVAVIDGGTDIKHECLKGQIWINKGEIPGNGIDDDKNGYIDDVNGWNFIGNKNGENVQYDNMEATRIYRLYNKIYSSGDASLYSKSPSFALYQVAKKLHLLKWDEAQRSYSAYLKLYNKYKIADSVIKAEIKNENYTIKELKNIKSTNTLVNGSVEFVETWLKKGLTLNDLKSAVDYFSGDYKYHYDVDFDPRNIVGDNWTDNSNIYYGNSDVAGPDPGHGTIVAGNLAAINGNNSGVEGVAKAVKLMIIRIVPDGDERDKDVANGIKYAIKNGAKVINMSFGKPFSPQKVFVDDVLKLAAKSNVLLIHAAGNDGENNDSIVHYPDKYDSVGNALLNNWITVGASGYKKGKTLAAPFSNYGKKTVDVFAPGVELWGISPGNKYGFASGTSMACPITSGAVAVIWSYFPDLTPVEIKDILMKSVVLYDKEVMKPSKSGEKVKMKFSDLSVSGGVINLYNAIKLAEQISASKVK